MPQIMDRKEFAAANIVAAREYKLIGLATPANYADRFANFWRQGNVNCIPAPIGHFNGCMRTVC